MNTDLILLSLSVRVDEVFFSDDLYPIYITVHEKQ